MILLKILDQYLASFQVSTTSIKSLRRHKSLKTFTKIFYTEYDGAADTNADADADTGVTAIAIASLFFTFI